jgi:hypothetical protein
MVELYLHCPIRLQGVVFKHKDNFTFNRKTVTDIGTFEALRTIDLTPCNVEVPPSSGYEMHYVTRSVYKLHPGQK